MDWDKAFSTMPNATGLGSLPQSWRWSYAPGSDMCAAVSADGEHAFQAYGLDSFDEGLAVALLSFAREHGPELIGPPDRPLAFAEGFSHPGYAFDSVLAVGPGIHIYYPKNPDMNSRIRSLVPAFRCEFAGDEDESELEYRYGRGGVPWTRWGREPRPFLKMRLRGDDGHLPNRRGFNRPRLLASWIARKEGDPGLLVEFENFRREVYTVVWTDTWTIAGPGEAPRRTGLDGLLEFVKSVLYGPNIAAGTGQFSA